MCCTLGPAELTSTHIYVGEAQKDGRYVHLLAYQNHAESHGPNAMILPFPTSVPMTEANVIDTTDFKGFLKNISEATQHRTRGLSKSFGGAPASSDLRAEVFDVGSYTVVLASKVSQIPEALKRVPSDKRPEISARMLIGYGNLYPNMPIAVCCWNGRTKPEPLMWFYEPTDPHTFFIPTMDAHDGGPPRPGTQVETDHVISVGSTFFPTGVPVPYYPDTRPDDVKKILPTKVHGYRPNRQSKNADTFVEVNAVRTATGANVRAIRKWGQEALDTQMMTGHY